jgi:hypothetical protein
VDITGRSTSSTAAASGDMSNSWVEAGLCWGLATLERCGPVHTLFSERHQGHCDYRENQRGWHNKDAKPEKAPGANFNPFASERDQPKDGR